MNCIDFVLQSPQLSNNLQTTLQQTPRTTQKYTALLKINICLWDCSLRHCVH